MARFKVLQSRNGQEAVQVGPVTRRFNGAVNIRDEHVSLAVAHLRGKSRAGERVVEGPTSDAENSPVAVILVGPDVEFSIVTWVEQIVRP